MALIDREQLNTLDKIKILQDDCGPQSLTGGDIARDINSLEKAQAKISKDGLKAIVPTKDVCEAIVPVLKDPFKEIPDAWDALKKNNSLDELKDKKDAAVDGMLEAADDIFEAITGRGAKALGAIAQTPCQMKSLFATVKANVTNNADVNISDKMKQFATTMDDTANSLLDTVGKPVVIDKIISEDLCRRALEGRDLRLEERIVDGLSQDIHNTLFDESAGAALASTGLSQMDIERGMTDMDFLKEIAIEGGVNIVGESGAVDFSLLNAVSPILGGDDASLIQKAIGKKARSLARKSAQNEYTTPCKKARQNVKESMESEKQELIDKGLENAKDLNSKNSTAPNPKPMDKRNKNISVSHDFTRKEMAKTSSKMVYTCSKYVMTKVEHDGAKTTQLIYRSDGALSKNLYVEFPLNTQDEPTTVLNIYTKSGDEVTLKTKPDEVNVKDARPTPTVTTYNHVFTSPNKTTKESYDEYRDTKYVWEEVVNGKIKQRSTYISEDNAKDLVIRIKTTKSTNGDLRELVGVWTLDPEDNTLSPKCPDNLEKF